VPCKRILRLVKVQKTEAMSRLVFRKIVRNCGQKSDGYRSASVWRLADESVVGAANEMSELRSEATVASARRKPPRLRPNSSLVTSALGAQRNGRGREGDRADRQPVKPERKARWSRRIRVWVRWPSSQQIGTLCGQCPLIAKP